MVFGRDFVQTLAEHARGEALGLGVDAIGLLAGAGRARFEQAVGGPPSFWDAAADAGRSLGVPAVRRPPEGVEFLVRRLGGVLPVYVAGGLRTTVFLLANPVRFPFGSAPEGLPAALLRRNHTHLLCGAWAWDREAVGDHYFLKAVLPPGVGGAEIAAVVAGLADEMAWLLAQLR